MSSFALPSFALLFARFFSHFIKSVQEESLNLKEYQSKLII